MESSYHIRISLFPNLNSDRHSDSVRGHLIQFESWVIFVREAGVFLLEKVRQDKKFFIVNEIRRTAKK